MADLTLLTPVLDTLTPAETRRVLAYFAGYDPEAFTRAVAQALDGGDPS